MSTTGAGKTTVFNLLTRFLAPTQGVILYQGEDITGARPAHIARKGRDACQAWSRIG